jgi:hypothetical protein
MNLPYGGSPDEWIARDGLPAAILGDAIKGKVGGLPSAEDDDGFVVYEQMIVFNKGGFAQVHCFPRSYIGTCMAFGGGLVPLHHQPSQRWAYRPCIYRWHAERTWQRQGSQQELDWRYAQHKAFEALQGGVQALWRYLEADPLGQANRRADELLESMLGSTQITELFMRGGTFRVIGGATGHHYRIELGNGFARVDPATNEPITSYCLHPEDWMPHADVALAHKLNLECPELEEETIKRANARDLPRYEDEDSPTELRRLRYAADMERELIAA